MNKGINWSFAANSLFLLTSVAFSYVWVNNPRLSFYTLQLVGILVIVYFLNFFLSGRKTESYNKATLIMDSIVFTMIIYLLVSTTGYFSSPLFFLFYFLAFGVALLFQPMIAMVLMVTICIFLLTKVSEANFYDNLAKIISLILVSPLAVFFGKQYLLALSAKKKIKILEDYSRLVEKDLNNANKDISQTETDILLFLSLNAKNGLIEIMDRISKILSTPLNYTQKEEAAKIRERTKELLEQTRKLEREVDRRTDK